jgi:uncharacterized protein (DUF488 family)
MIYTIGHSTRPIDEFIRILDAFEIKQVIDVRTIPRSRHNPQYNEGELGDSLRQHGIEYARLDGLGGLRHTTKNSENTAWKNASFRGFADYLQTPDFSRSVETLIELTREKRSVIMCAEAVPWRCHRSLIGDALLVRNIDVEDIFDETHSKPHLLTPWARVDGNRITYPEPVSSSPGAAKEDDQPQL